MVPKNRATPLIHCPAVHARKQRVRNKSANRKDRRARRSDSDTPDQIGSGIETARIRLSAFAEGKKNRDGLYTLAVNRYSAKPASA